MIALGAMSGTSTDGVDIAALEFDSSTNKMRFLGALSTEFSPVLRQNLLSLQQVPPNFSNGIDPFCFLLETRRNLTIAYAESGFKLIEKLGLAAQDIQVLGAHGQTIRHRPEAGYTYQVLDGALLATLLKINVVSDFRSKDLALGGQGAPLVPAFHQAWLSGVNIVQSSAVLNLGGFSNLTVLSGSAAPVLGGDCGPANCLMDLWAECSFGLLQDDGGLIAASGHVIDRLLEILWAHPFFAQPWPKSTGRDVFNAQWLDQCLTALGEPVLPENVMATLLALSVRAVKSCLPRGLDQVFVCGGGAKNSTLMNQLAVACSPVAVLPIEKLGLPAQAVEAAAFAWLAIQNHIGQPGNCPTVTGARAAAVLGALHLAR